MSTSQSGTTEVVVSRTIAAAPTEIYDLWIDPSSPGCLWYGIARAIVQPVVDGLFYHRVQFEGREWPHYGRFTVLERPSCIEHTWVSEATRGLESVVTLTLEPKDGRTLVTLRQSNIPDDEMGRRHEQGWGFLLAAIEQRVSRR